MKTKILFFTLLMLLYAAITVKAQQPVYPTPNSIDQIPFGKKLPTPVLNPRDEMMRKIYDKKIIDLPHTSFDTVSKQFIVHTPGQKNVQYPASGSYNTRSTGRIVNNTKTTSSGFHLTKDINTLSESYPGNFTTDMYTPSFAVLNGVSYFTADDGLHGSELWRSDGTTGGTYLVKDINPGEASSVIYEITPSNNKIFFSAYTPDNGREPWVSDGTEAGTHLLFDINSGIFDGNPSQFTNVNGTVFFIASPYSWNSQVWKTDGTTESTVLVKDLSNEYGYGIFESTTANGLLFFTAYSLDFNYYYYRRDLWRSDGTEAGTYSVKQIGPGYDYYSPMQLTGYDNKLFFSADDGTGRKLWTSDGTADGTSNAPGNNDVLMQPDYLSIYINAPFPIANNVLFIPGFTYADGSGLYEYDASNADGVVLVKDLTAGSDVDFVHPVDTKVVNNTLYFKVINSTGDRHDEIWKSNGDAASTQPVKILDPANASYSFGGSNGKLYFVLYTSTYGSELWKSDGTEAGTQMVKDLYPGHTGSNPYNLTDLNGKLLFSANNSISGNELWATDGSDIGTSLVKDINTTSTNSSYAGSNYLFKGIGSSGNGVVFNAITPALGAELYKSDGTSAGTVLLNDIATGEDWSYPNNFLFKNNVNYFIDDNAIGTALYKTNGTAAGLQRITANINRDVYYVVNYNIADNGLAFYTLGHRSGDAQELWRSDGTDAGTYMLTDNLSYYFNNYVAITGNTVFFIGGDGNHGYELWKSDGTIAGTKMVKDINPGFNGSDPYNLFVYKKDVYFGAYDGGLNFALWKSDGTEKGTIKLKSVTPAFYYSRFNTIPQHVFCVSNNILYFTATDFNAFGAELWKTNGTVTGTSLVKDINPYYSSFPDNLTDVKGTLYFTADDGVHGNEIWKSNGTSQSTQLVKDITPDYNYGYYYNLCSAGGKLYFLNPGTNPNVLWSSDGTAANTNPVNDAGLNGLSSIENLTGAGDKLFFGAYSHKYGAELYEGDASAATFIAARASSLNMQPATTNTIFDVLLYPNPVHSTAALQIKGGAKNITVTITDMAGRQVWYSSYNNLTQINLSTEKLMAGVYTITVKSGVENKNIKLVKE